MSSMASSKGAAAAACVVSGVPKVGYQGVPGAYSEAAALEVFRGAGMDITPVGYPSFEEVFGAVAGGSVQYAALPFENTLGGSIHGNFDLLLRYHGKVHILGEHSFRVRHSLLALPGATFKDVTKAMSHPQALAQTDGYLRANGLTPVVAYDTAGSAKLIAEQQLKDTAAVASIHAAKVHGLQVLDSGIEDDTNNFTRFLILGRTPVGVPLGTPAKSSVMFVPKRDEPGALFKALSVFAVRDINLSKIESRPHKPGSLPPDTSEPSASASASASTSASVSAAPLSRKRSREGEDLTSVGSGVRPVANFEYAFYVDLLAAASEERTQNALRHLTEISSGVRLLGCYPVDGVLLHPPEQPSPSLSPPVVTTVRANPLRVGIIGFGTFGQFLARRWVSRGHVVHAFSRTDYSEVARQAGVSFHSSVDELAEQQLEVLVVSVSILSFEKVISKLPKALLEQALVIDVLSVKAYAKQVMLAQLPASSDILCIHPMFGPDSGKFSWHALPCVYEQVRIRDHHRAARFLGLFEDEGCAMVRMSCEMHDQLAAGSQFVTHLTGRLLAKLKLAPSPIATKGFRALLDLVDNTCRDSFDLFYALYSHNSNSSDQLEQFSAAFDELRSELLNFSPSAAASNANKPQVSRLVAGMAASQTVAISDLAIELKRQGVPVISLAVGEPDFPPPKEVLSAAHAAVDLGLTKYTAMPGTHELRQAVCDYLSTNKAVQYTPEQVICCNGGKQAILQTMLAICNPGDEVIIPAPYWTSYLGITQLCRAKPVVVNTNPERDYCIQPDQLEAAITPASRIFILCNPSNPTGAVHPKALLEQLAEVVRRHPQLLVIADEIYEAITYDEPHFCFAAIDGMYDRTVLINGFSKGVSMTGFRLGYMAAPLYITKAAAKVQGNNTSCACSLSQHAGVAAIKQVGPAFYEENLRTFRAKRDLVVTRLQQMPGVECPMPQGAFYVFPTVSAFFGRKAPDGSVIADALSLCEYLMKKCHVALVPGGAFGTPNALRISYATSIPLLTKAMDSIQAGLAALE